AHYQDTEEPVNNPDLAEEEGLRSPKEEDLPYNPDVTDEDLENLQHDNQHTDGGDDEMLRERREEVDFTGEDLDVPGSKTARESGRKGLPDEENQLFSEDNKNANN